MKCTTHCNYATVTPLYPLNYIFTTNVPISKTNKAHVESLMKYLYVKFQQHWSDPDHNKP